MGKEIVNQVLILFLMAIVGFYAAKKKYINKETNNGLCKILLNIALPMLVINSFTTGFSKDMLLTAEKLFLYSIVVHVALIIFAKLIYIKTGKKSIGVSKFVTVFSNSGFIGYPVMNGLYGSKGVFYCAVFGIVINVFMFSYGIIVIKNENGSILKELKKAILNPVIISTIIGIVILASGIKLPYVLQQAIKSTGSLTSPLSMIIVGVMLEGIDFKMALSGKFVYVLSFVRLIAVPVVTFLVVRAFGAPILIADILVILESMPAPSNAAAFCVEYGSDEVLAVKSIFVTTVFSMITIPIVLNFLT